jgi:hypothetical protein
VGQGEERLPELPKLVIAGNWKRVIMEDRQSAEHQEKHSKSPEARYSYYRRCQVFRRNGEQCKAPAEKESAICHAHAAQRAMTMRRERERRGVLAEAVAEMRRRGKADCEMADLLTDFKGIQVTLAMVSRALIGGRIDCKTAGRLLVHLQTMSKLLWMLHRKTSTTKAESPNRRSQTRVKMYSGSRNGSGAGPSGPICLLCPFTPKAGANGDPKAQPNLRTSRDDASQEAEFFGEARTHDEVELSEVGADERRSNKSQELRLPAPLPALTPLVGRDMVGEDPRVAVETKIVTFTQGRRSCRDGPWEEARAA